MCWNSFQEAWMTSLKTLSSKSRTWRSQGRKQARPSCGWALPSYSTWSGISAPSIFSLSQFSLLANFQVTFLRVSSFILSGHLLPVTCSRLFCHRCMLLHSKFSWRLSSSTKDLFLSIMLLKIPSWHAHNQHSQSQPNLVQLHLLFVRASTAGVVFWSV